MFNGRRQRWCSCCPATARCAAHWCTDADNTSQRTTPGGAQLCVSAPLPQDLLARNFSLIILGKASGRPCCAIQIYSSCCAQRSSSWWGCIPCQRPDVRCFQPHPTTPASCLHSASGSTAARLHGLQGGGRRDSSIVRIPEELVEAGLIRQYEKLPFQVRSCGLCGWQHKAAHAAVQRPCTVVCDPHFTA